MKVVVCVRQSVSGELNPFDACAYEAALRSPDAEVTLLSMGPEKARDFRLNLTRLGAARAVHLCDRAFAGADTLATAYTLSLAVARLAPDLILCGRQTVDGDTGQVGPELSVMAGYSLVTGVMQLDAGEDGVMTVSRDGRRVTTPYPALLTVERIHNLRLPSIRSRVSEVVVWDALTLGADVSRTGLGGSPTRVVKTFENDQDRRRCTFIEPDELPKIIKRSLEQSSRCPCAQGEVRHGGGLGHVVTVGEEPMAMARSISDHITVIDMDTPERLVERIRAEDPDAVLWASDPVSKERAPQVAAMLQLGLCADCTLLETEGDQLMMYRPAFSGNIIAKIRSTTRPAMATVRTPQSDRSPITVGVGMGAVAHLNAVRAWAQGLGADLAATRLTVDHDHMPYERQVGLTGKSISPDVYIALGISGAVHHIAGIRCSGTIIAVNEDKDAPIFDYADYGIVADVSEILK